VSRQFIKFIPVVFPIRKLCDYNFFVLKIISLSQEWVALFDMKSPHNG
jgi:hypothetical protein